MSSRVSEGFAADRPFRQRVETYLAEPRASEQPKETTKALAALVESTGWKDASLLDVGCAVGELLGHFRQRFPAFHLFGLDASEPLLKRARDVLEPRDVALRVDDALTFSFRDYQATPFDIVTCAGVLSCVDEPEPLLENLVANTRRGGRVYIVSMLNDDDIDVRVRYRDNRHMADEWQRGQNIHAAPTLARWLTGRVQSCRFLPFEMPFDVPRRPDYPHRSWTFRDAEGRRLVTSGLCLLYHERILEIVP